MAGVYWVGANGRYYAKASDFEGVKDVTNVINDPTNPWIDIINGYDKIDDPNPPEQEQPTYRNVAADPAAQDQADEQAYWEDQLENADRQLGRLPTQEETLRKNAANAYKSAYERLVGDKNTTERDYTTTRGRAVEDNIVAKNDINTSVRNRNQGLQRLLGSRGAGNSSAARILAPFAAAQEGNKQRGQVQKAFGRNLQNVDTAWGDYQKDWDESAGDLITQRDNTISQGVAGLRQTKADLLEAKGDAAVQKNMAAGQNYRQARSARAPYSDRIKDLIAQIDKAGLVKNFTPKAAAYKAPTMEAYTYDRYAAPTAGSGVNPGAAQQAGAYWTLLGRDEEERRRQAV